MNCFGKSDIPYSKTTIYLLFSFPFDYTFIEEAYFSMDDHTEPVFVNLLRSPGIDFQFGRLI
jgi:hypothetical protein